MSEVDPTRLSRIVGVAVVAALLAGLVFALRAGRDDADGPVPVAWDRVSCARCGMLVGEPSFAAQLRTRDGEVLYFDDPGCLLLHEHEHALEVRSRWFHHTSEDRWVSGESVRFLPADASPMSYGLAATDRDEPGAIPWAEALRTALQREAQRRER